MAEETNELGDLEYARVNAPGRTALRHRIIAVGAMLIVVFVLGTLAWYLMNRILGNTLISTSTTAFISSIRSEAKYVVASQSLTVTVQRAEEYRGWWGFYLGTTTASIRVDDCRVQYIIPTEKVRSDDFVFDQSHNTLTVTLPRPVLDQDIVDIPSDPAKWWIQSSNGWSRFNKAEVAAEAQKAIRNETLVTSYRRGFDEATEAVAVNRLKAALRKFLKQPDLSIEIIFRPSGTPRP